MKKLIYFATLFFLLIFFNGCGYQPIYKSQNFNPHIMFITKPKIMDKWFKDLFGWLSKCEKIFGFSNLRGYDTKRMYAYLAERYLSFWFRKYSNYIEWPYITIDTKNRK